MKRRAIEDPAPALWGARLTLFSEANFVGGGKKLLAFNRVLERTWNQGDPLVWICTRARCEILRMSTKEYGREIGCAPNSVTTFESNPLSVQTFSKPLSGGLQFWTRIVKTGDLEKSSLQRLQEARDHVLKAIDLYFDGGVFGLLMQWKYQCGSAAFEAATELSTGYLSSLKSHQPEITPRRLLVWATSLNLIPTNTAASETVRHPVFQSIKERYRCEAMKKGRPEEIVYLQCALSAFYRELSSTGIRPPYENLSLSCSVARSLFHYELRPWEAVSQIFDRLVESNVMSAREYRTLQKKWTARFRSQRSSFEDTLRERMDSFGMDCGVAARILGISKEDAHKPSDPVYHYLRDRKHSRFVPPATLAALLAESEDDFRMLLNQKRKDIQEDAARRVNVIRNDLYLERRAWGVRYGDLSLPKQRIQNLENSHAGRDGEKDDRVLLLKEIRHVGGRRAKQALGRWITELQAGTVPKVMKIGIEKLGVNRASEALGICRHRVSTLRSGKDFPEYSLLESLAAMAGIPITLQLASDWHQRLFCSLSSRSPIEIAILMLVRRFYPNFREFLRAKNLLTPAGGNPFQADLQRKGQLSQRNLAQLLRALDIRFGTPLHQFLAYLNESPSRTALLKLKENLSYSDIDQYGRWRNLIGSLRSLPAGCSPDPVRGKSLSALIELKESLRNGLVRVSSETQQEIAWLRNLPGVTINEMCAPWNGERRPRPTR